MSLLTEKERSAIRDALLAEVRAALEQSRHMDSVSTRLQDAVIALSAFENLPKEKKEVKKELKS